jgi:hypothetical protein
MHRLMILMMLVTMISAGCGKDDATMSNPTGACCAPAGTCTVTTQTNCIGTWTEGGVCTPNNPCTQPPGDGSIIPTGTNSYILNLDATLCGAPWEGWPMRVVLTLGPGTWEVAPTNPGIDARAKYTAWSWGSMYSSWWTTHMGVYDLATGDQYYRHKGTPNPGLYSSPQAACDDDPLNVPFRIDVAQDTQFGFYTGDSMISDNLGGVSVTVTLVTKAVE